MTGCRVQAGVALATPVRPDELGANLEGYSRALPTLHALRLCHRFGRGPDVHVTKLPNEIELAIEALVIATKQLEWTHWRSAFYHFDGRCDYIDHVCDSPPLEEWASEEIENCDACTEGHWNEVAKCNTLCKKDDDSVCEGCRQQLGPTKCVSTCRARRWEYMNDLIIDRGFYSEDYPIPNRDCEGWENMIDQSPGGRFVKYDIILQKHFGLQAHFSTARRADSSDRTAWPFDPAHRYHFDVLKTTICYLVLAKQHTPERYYQLSWDEKDNGSDSIETTQTIFVNQGTPKDKAEATKRFSRAMSILNLEAWLHPSQRDALLMPWHENGREAGATNHVPTEWPQMIFIVKTRAEEI